MSKRPPSTINKKADLGEGYFWDQHTGFKARMREAVIDDNLAITTERNADWEPKEIRIPGTQALPFSRPEGADSVTTLVTIDYTPVVPSNDHAIWNTVSGNWDEIPYTWENI